LMRDLGYGKGYVYDHATEEGFSGQNYFPDGVERRVFYEPKGEGAEARVKELKCWRDRVVGFEIEAGRVLGVRMASR